MQTVIKGGKMKASYLNKPCASNPMYAFLADINKWLTLQAVRVIKYNKEISIFKDAFVKTKNRRQHFTTELNSKIY